MSLIEILEGNEVFDALGVIGAGGGGGGAGGGTTIGTQEILSVYPGIHIIQ